MFFIWKCQVSVPLLHRAALGIGDFVRRADHHRLLARSAPRPDAGARGGEHLLRILQFARTGHQHVPRHGDGIIEFAVFEIKLGAEIRQRVPAVQIVIDRHARIPLGDVVDFAVLRWHMLRCDRRKRPARCNDNGYGFRACRRGPERLVQPDLHAGIGRRYNRLSSHGLAGRSRPCREYSHRWPRRPAGRPRNARAGILFVDVLVELQPQAIKRRRAVVGVGDDLVGRYCRSPGSRRGVDFVIRAFCQ